MDKWRSFTWFTIHHDSFSWMWGYHPVIPQTSGRLRLFAYHCSQHTPEPTLARPFCWCLDHFNPALQNAYKQNLVHIRTQEKGAVMPQESELDLPASVPESLAEAWLSSGLPWSQGHKAQQSWVPCMLAQVLLKKVAITAIKKKKKLSRVWLLATSWTTAYQVPPSMGFSRQEYWSELPFPSLGDLPDPGIETRFPTLQADTLLSEPPGESSLYPYQTWP